ncbi:hypothetical protein Ahy_B04g070590 isoform A [Arachis hypogaea]|uniref:Transposase MuDR plant domain-containing protein n=1 Tax=Arachis hypogaea TaxID=3818 RepID=A0A444ZHT3_ARAHY|nr:hypothetical protein Ahy_B04g070590 isoform A [Arachis hypogaea]
MASEESFVVLVHHRGSIKRKTRFGVKFTDKDPLCIVVNPTTSYDDLVRSVLMKLGLEGAKRVKKFFYRIPVTILHDTVKYDCLTIGSDEDLQVMFLCRRQFPEVRTPELLAKLIDVVSSSRGSNRNTTNVATAAGSSSRAAVASSSVPVYEPNALEGVPPVGVGDGVLGDADEDDVEPDTIEDDSGDEVGATGPALAGGGSSSSTQQYPPHFSSLDLDAMRHEGVLGVKSYSIRRGVQYKVLESDHRLYVGKCSEFGNGCTWLIRLSLRKRKGVWEVKRYNRPHTCLATCISSDHRSLDYHVISAFIMPMVRADASVSI